MPELVAQAIARVAPWLEQHFGITIALDLASLKRSSPRTSTSAKDLSLQLLSGAQDRRADPAVDPRQPRADPGRDVLPAARLEHDRRAPVHAGAARTGCRRRARSSTDIDRVLAEFLRGQLHGDDRARASTTRSRCRSRDSSARSRSASSPVCWCSFPTSASASASCSACSRRCCNGRAGRASSRCSPSTASASSSRTTCCCPCLVGDRIGLHPLAVIFALLAFGQLFGFAGVLLALPASAALLVGLRHLRAAYVASPVYGDDDRVATWKQLDLRARARRSRRRSPTSSPAATARRVASARALARRRRRRDRGVVLWGAAGVGQARICCARRSRRPRCAAARRCTRRRRRGRGRSRRAGRAGRRRRRRPRRRGGAGAAVHALQPPAGRAAGSCWLPRRGAARRGSPLRDDLRTRLGGDSSTRSCRSPTPTSPRRSSRYARERGLRARRRRDRLSPRARPPRHDDAGRDAGGARSPLAGAPSGRSPCRCCASGCSAACRCRDP